MMGSLRPQSSERKSKWVVIRRQLLQVFGKLFREKKSYTYGFLQQLFSWSYLPRCAVHILFCSDCYYMSCILEKCRICRLRDLFYVIFYLCI